jgi:hypothetical protein
MLDRVVEDQTWFAEDLILPQTIGRSLYARPKQLRPVADKEYASNVAFWSDVLDPQKATAERVIRFRGFNLFEWIPRNPGLYHTDRGREAREVAQYHIRSIDPIEYQKFEGSADAPPDHARAFRKITAGKVAAHKIIYTPQGKSSMLQGGVGCVRLRPVELKRGGLSWFMSATSTDAPDEGIPLLVPDVIYQKVIDEVRRNGNAACDIIGRTKFIPKEFSDLYSRTYRIQRLYVDVEEIKETRQAEPGEVAVATSFLSEYEGSPKIYASYVTFDPGFKGAQQSATQWMQEEYVRGLYRGSVLTDFDQQQTEIPGTLFSLDQILTSPDLAAKIHTVEKKVGFFDWDMLLKASFSFHEHEEHIMVKSVVKGNGHHVNITTGQESPIHVNTTEPGVQATPQEKYRHLYTLLAFGAGTAFLVALLAISLIWPNPTPPQLKVQASILALAAAGFATVMTGLINLKTKLGTQLAVGATGALAVLVLFYLFNPAVLQ